MVKWFDPVKENRVVEQFVNRFLSGRPSYTVIHPADEMYLYNLDVLHGSSTCAAILYYLKGYQIAYTVREVMDWRFGGTGRVSTLLDFAGGYGRATRFLLEYLPRTRIWTADIQSGAVHFQTEISGVNARNSTVDPRTFAMEGKHDLILAASFFTHIPKASFQAWLRTLYDLLTDRGILIFTTQGPESLGGVHDWSDGMVFLPVSESRVLDAEHYGTSFVTDEFVRAAVAEATGDEAQLFLVPRGLCGHQNLYLLFRSNGVPDAPRLTVFPAGDLDRVSLNGLTQLELDGWARGSRDSGIDRVELRVDNELVDGWTPSKPLIDEREKWHLDLAEPYRYVNGIGAVHAVSASGAMSIIAIGALRRLFPLPPPA